MAAGADKTQSSAELAAGIRALDRALIERLLAGTQELPTIGARMKAISTKLLGRPYIVGPLIGSPTRPEEFVTRMDRFDCVTFIETVLALAGAHDVEQFVARLRNLRYEGGAISWRQRLHYTTDWSRSNVARGFLLDLTNGEGAVERSKRLDSLAGYPARDATFSYFPKPKLNAVKARLADGDLIYFVSTRKGLDTFHVGMIIRDGERVLLRHAARSKQGVLDQELGEFCQANRMSGFIITRPTEPTP